MAKKKKPAGYAVKGIVVWHFFDYLKDAKREVKGTNKKIYASMEVNNLK